MSINNQVYKDLLKNKLIKRSKIDVYQIRQEMLTLKCSKIKFPKLYFWKKS